jgi:hypothetical protein
VTVVPRLHRLVVSMCEKKRGILYLKNKNTHLAGNFPIGTGEVTSTIEHKNGTHRRLRRGRGGDSDGLRERA